MFKAVIAALLGATVASYPLYKQCNPAWGKQMLGTSGGKTICQIGCLVSSVSMTLPGHNPGTLNNWLKTHHGFYNGNGFLWGSVAPLGLHFQGFNHDHNQMANAIRQGKIVILIVHNGGHFVLATGVNGQTFYVNDPGYNVGSYTFAQVKSSGILTRGARLSDEDVEYYDFEDEDTNDNDYDFQMDPDQIYDYDFSGMTEEYQIEDEVEPSEEFLQ